MTQIRVVDARDWRADPGVQVAQLTGWGQRGPIASLLWAARSAESRNRTLLVVREWIPWARRAAAVLGAAYLPPSCSEDQAIGLRYVMDEVEHAVYTARARHPGVRVEGRVLVGRRVGDWREACASADLVVVEDLDEVGGLRAAAGRGVPLVAVSSRWRPGQIREVLVVVERLRDLPTAIRFVAENRPPAARLIHAVATDVDYPVEASEAALFDQLQIARRLYPALREQGCRLTGTASSRGLPQLGPHCMLIMTRPPRHHRFRAKRPLHWAARRRAAALAVVPGAS